MRSVVFISILFCAVVCAVAQQNYDGRNGPIVIGPPGQQVYIRGQNEGPYQVDGVGGTFQYSPNRGEHVYTDEQGNTYVNRKNAHGSGLVRQRGQSGVDGRRVYASGQSAVDGKQVYAKGQSGLDGRRVYASRPEGAGVGGGRRRRNYLVNRRSGALRDRRSPQLKVDRRNPEYLGNSFRYPNGRYNLQ